MSMFRHLVSKKKRRFQQDGFDLDLAYITNNVIAMGYPSQGAEAAYRNPIKETVRFLEARHGGHYKVYNLCSERLYDPSFFKNSVANFPFDDHNCPPLPLILSFCQSASEWLHAHPENVIAVHCKAGKSRTGLMVCSLLLHEKVSPNTPSVLSLYNLRRTHDGKGVTIASQRRYIKYFEAVLHNKMRVPRAKRFYLMVVHLQHCPANFRPHFVVSNHTEGVLFNSKNNVMLSEDGDSVMMICSQGVRICGDTKIQFFNKGSSAFYSWFHTAFLQAPVMVLGRNDLDKFGDKKKFHEDFTVRLQIAEDDRSSDPEWQKLPVETPSFHEFLRTGQGAPDQDDSDESSEDHEGDTRVSMGALPTAGLEGAGTSDSDPGPPPPLPPKPRDDGQKMSFAERRAAAKAAAAARAAAPKATSKSRKVGLLDILAEGPKEEGKEEGKEEQETTKKQQQEEEADKVPDTVPDEQPQDQAAGQAAEQEEEEKEEEKVDVEPTAANGADEEAEEDAKEAGEQ